MSWSDTTPMPSAGRDKRSDADSRFGSEDSSQSARPPLVKPSLASCETATTPPDGASPIRLSYDPGLACGHRMQFHHLKRREFITLLGGAAAAWPLAVRAQQVSSVPRIGYLSPGSASPGPLNYYDEFRRELRELGYVEGQNIVIDYRFANGKFDRLPQLAAELVQLNVDIIVSVVTQASLAAKNATRTIPIVIVSVGDPVGAGLVASLARPSANVTGNSSMTIEVIGKSLALLKQAVPKASPMAVLWNPDNVTYQGQILRETEVAAGKLGVQLQTFEVRGPDEFDRTFAAITSASAATLLVLPDPVFSAYTARIADLANKSQLPTMYGLREDAVAGGLMAYGPNYADLYRRAASYVNKILKGAKPADLPVERPTNFEFVINLKTAKLLGIELPPTLVALADEVIE
jgi:putative tryptophan/tyrosine transport system substrate-binding protein